MTPKWQRLLGVMALVALIGAGVFAWSKADDCSHAQNCRGYRAAYQRTIKRSNEESFWEWTAHDAVGFYTAILSLFTGALVVASIWQGYFLIRADRTAREAADAAFKTASAIGTQNSQIERSIAEATRAADAMKEAAAAAVAQTKLIGAQTDLMESQKEILRQNFMFTHRPKIILREAFIGTLAEGEPVKVFFNLANIGESGGRIIRSVVNVEVVGGARLLGHPSIEPKDDLGTIHLRPGEAKLIAYQGTTPKWVRENFGEKSRVTIGGPQVYRSAWIHLAGQILYEDGNGVPRRTAFRRELRPEVQRFYRIPDEPDLDYTD